MGICAPTHFPKDIRREGGRLEEVSTTKDRSIGKYIEGGKGRFVGRYERLEID